MSEDTRSVFVEIFKRALEKQAHEIAIEDYEKTANQYFDAIVKSGKPPAMAMVSLVVWVDQRPDMPTQDELISLTHDHPGYKAN